MLVIPVNFFDRITEEFIGIVDLPAVPRVGDDVVIWTTKTDTLVERVQWEPHPHNRNFTIRVFVTPQREKLFGKKWWLPGEAS